jgi:PHP family Zn ribbon phosphoesterase
MSPVNIINKAKEKKIDIIGITDHNSTKQCKVCFEIGINNGVFVLCGAEITTKEEVHCLTFFENFETLKTFQGYIESHLPDIKNDENRFGYQLIIDEEENIIGEEEKMLNTALDISIDQLEEFVHSMNGIFIPAHVDKPKYSLISQLGFVPADIKADALEISKHISQETFYEKFNYLKKFMLIQNSDAHYLDAIGEVSNDLNLSELTFIEIKKALKTNNSALLA